MNDVVKSKIFPFFLGIVVSLTVTVSAAILVPASSVSISSSKTDKTTLQDSLNELYELYESGPGRKYDASEISVSTSYNTNAHTLKDAVDDLYNQVLGD